MSNEGDIPEENTDRELWREDDDYYAPSIHVTKEGNVGINVGGFVIVKPLREWHSLPEILDMLIEQMRWIPVSERLPEEIVEAVLVGRNTGVPSVMEARYINGEFMTYNFGLVQGFKNPTHWKPLPPAPDKEPT